MLTDDFKPTPYWWEGLPPPSAEPAEPPARADVAVIGGGFTGLSAALTLARAGRQTVVFDADAIGHGASSRNAGAVTRMLHTGFAHMAERMSRAQFGALTKEAADAFETVRDLIERERIPCDWRMSGRFLAAASRAHAHNLRVEMDFMQNFSGVQCRWLDAADQGQEYGTRNGAGGVVVDGTAVLHPGKLVHNMAARVVMADAVLAPSCRVLSVARERDGFKLTHALGKTKVRDVVVATNGYADGLVPHFRRRVLPVQATMMATEPVSPELLKRAIPNGRMVIDSRRAWRYLRPSPDGTRLLFGSLSGYRDNDMPRMARRLHAEMADSLPDFAGVKISHCWGGMLGLSFDRIPHVGVHDGMHYALAMNGTGVPVGTHLGRKIALRLLGSPEGRTAYDDLPFPTRPTYNGNPWFVPWIARWWRFRDRFDP
ncbi:MAG: FAD-binding oxidoreductase [Alphaproteobacteria bacterium]|nr:FAD-binding oxidoreductase [Alphaproteobacteria bacterium]